MLDLIILIFELLKGPLLPLVPRIKINHLFHSESVFELGRREHDLYFNVSSFFQLSLPVVSTFYKPIMKKRK